MTGRWCASRRPWIWPAAMPGAAVYLCSAQRGSLSCLAVAECRAVGSMHRSLPQYHTHQRSFRPLSQGSPLSVSQSLSLSLFLSPSLSVLLLDSLLYCIPVFITLAITVYCLQSCVHLSPAACLRDSQVWDSRSPSGKPTLEFITEHTAAIACLTITQGTACHPSTTDMQTTMASSREGVTA